MFINKYICLLIWSFFIGCIPSFALSVDSLVKQSDIVVGGQITRISGASMDDVGTEYYQVTIDIDSIYKQNIFINSKQQTFTWIVTKGNCNQTDLRACIEHYSQKKYIFFLDKKHIHGGEELKNSHILPFYKDIEAAVGNSVKEQKLVVNDYYRNKLCLSNCELCHHIQFEEWGKLEKYIKKHISRGIKWHTHRRVKWMLYDKNILAILPSSMGMRLMVTTQKSERHIYLGLQVGYVKTYMTWLPYLISRMGYRNAYRHFSKEKTDTLILRKFYLDSNYTASYIQAYKHSFTYMLTDTTMQKIYGNRMELSDEDVLLASAFDEDYRLYHDYQTMPDYIARAKEYIDKLASHGSIYLLCITTTHTVPEIGEYALQALKKINDPRAILFLIRLAEFTAVQSEKGYIKPEAHEGYNITLKETLDALTGCFTSSQSVPFGVSGYAVDIALSLQIWKSKYVMFDDGFLMVY